MIHKLIGLVLAIMILSNTGSAQLLSRKKANDNEKAPKAILVQLSTSSRKMDYYRRAKKQALVKQLETDVQNVMDKMVMDFNDNFNYCPVYYFMDTNANLVLEQKFDGVILDNQMHPISYIDLNAEDPYNIVLFGIVTKDASNYNGHDNSDPMDAGYNVGSTSHRLIVLNKDFKAINKPLPNGLNNINRGKLRQPVSSYIYDSPKFDIYYRPYARNLSAKMLSYYGPYPYK